MEQLHAKVLNIYCDGACAGNQHAENRGGWGAILEYGGHSKELYGGERNTTNNRMELSALIGALEAVKSPGQTIRVFSDSAYVMKCLRDQWYVKWRANGWLTSAKKPVENRELWEKLLSLVEKHAVRYYLVKGHINISSKSISLKKIYGKFTANNGPEFSYEDFLHITERNNRADALANIGISGDSYHDV
jgi:ribonuclease HI